MQFFKLITWMKGLQIVQNVGQLFILIQKTAEQLINFGLFHTNRNMANNTALIQQTLAAVTEKVYEV